MSFFDDLIERPLETLVDLGSDFLGSSSAGSLLSGYAIEKFGGDFFNPPPPTVGYQGDVPRYTAVREPIYSDIATTDMSTGRRPGSAGRRYFTDTLYAETPEVPMPTLAEARQRVGQQAEGIRSIQNRTTPMQDTATPDSNVTENVTTNPSDVANINPIPTYKDILEQYPVGGVAMTEGGEVEREKRRQAHKDFLKRYAEATAAGSRAADEMAGKLLPSDMPKPLVDFLMKVVPKGILADEENKKEMAEGGRYLAGSTDGMADVVPARIEGGQEARLSDGEFVIPADVVSHLGNGNSDAGAKQLYGMMDDVREARTGRKEQGIQIDPNKFMPNMAQGGIAKFQGADGSLVENTQSDMTTANQNAQSGITGLDPKSYTPTAVGRQGALAEFAGEYTTDLLGKGRAIAETPYEAYTGPLTAGESGLQTQAFQGLTGLQTPDTMGGYTPTTLDATQVSRFMNPYLEAALNPQIEAAVRQAEIQRVADAGRLTKAGAYGGSRQAVMEAEGQRALQDRIADITGRGYATAYDKALARFDQEEARQREAQQMANKYGFDVLGAQTRGGQLQRAIEGEGIAADRAQFEEEKLFPYKQIQYQKSLLEGLPIAAQEIQYSQPSGIQNVLGNTAFIDQLIGQEGNILYDLFGLGRSGSEYDELIDMVMNPQGPFQGPSREDIIEAAADNPSTLSPEEQALLDAIPENPNN
jgi:hypothetical protein